MIAHFFLCCFVGTSVKRGPQYLRIEEFRKRNKEAQTDLEFPDEIELHPSELARDKLHRYRGLKNFRTSPWERDEDALYQPPFWEALARIENYKGTKSKALHD